MAKLDHGYTGISKYRIEVFENVTGELVGTFRHVSRSDVQEFFHALDSKEVFCFRECYITVRRELAEKGELDD